MTGQHSDDLKDAERRVMDAAARLGLDIAIRRMPQSTRTAEEAAAAVGCNVGQIVKSLIFRGKASGRPVLLLVSGANRVDEAKAAAAVGEALVRPDAQLVRDVTGFAIGGIPPFGHAHPSATFMDLDLGSYPTVWAAAGTPNSVFAIAPARLAEATQSTLIAMR
jgi:prolyl-tRNA editing enzyme YbaK/EbsC (Cys-tRNA(Pro) deacylase)